MARSVEQIEARLQAAAARAEQRALGRLSRLVQPAARRRAGAELGRARAAAARAPAQAERIAQRTAERSARDAQRTAERSARAADLTPRQVGALKGAATRKARAAQLVDAHNRQRQLNRDQGFAPPPPLAPPPKAKKVSWFSAWFPVGEPIFKGSYITTAVDELLPGAAVLTLTRKDGGQFFIGVLRGPDGKPRFTPRALTHAAAAADVAALWSSYFGPSSDDDEADDEAGE